MLGMIQVTNARKGAGKTKGIRLKSGLRKPSENRPRLGLQTRDEGGLKPASGEGFDWPVAAGAEALLRARVDGFLKRNGFGLQLARRMREETGTDFFEWIDHLVLPREDQAALEAAGFTRERGVETAGEDLVYAHPRASLPRVLLRGRQGQELSAVALKPESITAFMAAHSVAEEPEGEPWSRYRRVVVARESGTALEAVERRAYRGFVAAPLAEGELKARVKARELWQTRPRRFEDAAEGFRVARRVLGRVLELAGRDVGCELFFEAERAHWESRNRAARIQKHRQDRLGLGWGNHDHHTFRCSRERFAEVVEFLAGLGFEKRERFYAGAEAGWGAQVLEQPVTGVVVFADVDLTPEETEIDFSAAALPASSRLGTVGLWVELHGESLLEAGLHHVEARFEFDALREQLKASGVEMMKPFSDFAFLRQAFTEGERWAVSRARAERLKSAGLITAEQCERFVREGALGSHLENLQRHGGFKGFNQKAVSAVIAATDPRGYVMRGA